MVGEDELIRGCTHLTTVTVISQTAKLYRLKKDDFLKIRQSSEEAWNSILEHSRALSAQSQSLYLEKIKNISEVTDSLKKTEDLNIYCSGLMKEMLWGEPPITIKLYQLKKDLEEKVAKNIKDNSAVVY